MNTRHHFSLLFVSLGAFALVGCSPKDDETTRSTPAGNAAGAAVDQVQHAASQAGDALTRTWNDVKDATYDERAQVRASLNQLSTSLDARISDLQTRSATVADASKETWNRSLEQLREARTDLQKEIADLENASAETWDAAKARVANAWERVRQASADLETPRTN